MRFRNLYQADFAPIQPRPELLEATQALYHQPKPSLKLPIRASALGLAACLLLAVGLCLSLPGNAQNGQNAQQDSGSGDQLQIARSLPETTQMARTPSLDSDIDPYKMDEAMRQSPTVSRGARQKAAANGIRLCALPLADSQYDCLAGYADQYVYDCIVANEPIIEYEYSAKDQAPNPFFAAELLRPQAPDSTAYLAQCGLWLVRYIWYK